MEDWVLLAAAAAMLVRVGLALYTSGLVRAKNASGSLLRHFADVCLTTLALWAVGLALFNPRRAPGIVDTTVLFGPGTSPLVTLKVFPVAVMTLLASGVVVGSLAERARFWPSLAPSLLLGGLVVPVLMRVLEGYHFHVGLGFHDYAGASFIHLAGAACAAAGAVVVGPRDGKYNRDGSSNMIPGHNLPLAGAGALLMTAGWLPYLLMFNIDGGVNAGGAIAFNALLAAAAAGLASLAFGEGRYGKPDISLALTGVLAGLVGVSAGADRMSGTSAVLTGAVAGVLVPWIILRIDLVWRIDDPTGAIAAHGVGGVWSLVAAGLFAHSQSLGAHVRLVGSQLLGAALTIAVAGGSSLLLFAILKRLMPLRVREADEFDGLDLAEHDIGSYPDFQQNTIKSYHLREA